ENRQRQQRRQEFLDSVPDLETDPPVPAIAIIFLVDKASNDDSHSTQNQQASRNFSDINGVCSRN
ncbi:MAG: hypothetical protein VW729_19065, partial [Deltaproteobacteria bacterium]